MTLTPTILAELREAQAAATEAAILHARSCGMYGRNASELCLHRDALAGRHLAALLADRDSAEAVRQAQAERLVALKVESDRGYDSLSLIKADRDAQRDRAEEAERKAAALAKAADEYEEKARHNAECWERERARADRAVALILQHAKPARPGSWPCQIRVEFALLAQWNTDDGVEPKEPLSPQAALDAALAEEARR